MRALRAAEIGIPRHRWEPGDEDTFALSSHARAREALDLALSIDAPGFNVYVLGEDRTGRMSATVAYLSAICTAARSARKDWIYLQNFRDACLATSDLLWPAPGAEAPPRAGLCLWLSG